jgi:hypothetical protein
VSQISPPIRILLVLTVAVLGVYMLFLRPKTEVAPPAAPAPNTQTGAPAVSQPGKIAEAAQGAVKAADGQLQSQESVDGVDSGESAAGTATTPGTANAKSGAAAAAAAGVDLKGLPKPVARAIRHHKTLVLLFWNGKSADDKAVHQALKKVDHWNGRVFVDTAPIKQIARYGRIARGVDVEQSPTVVVADTDLHAETLVGYVDALTINQAVVDAFTNTGGVFTDRYLRKVDAVCREYRSDFNHIPHTFTSNPAEFSQAISHASAVYGSFAAEFVAIKAPAKWRAFRSEIASANAQAFRYYAGLSKYLGENPTAARVTSGLTAYQAKADAINKIYRPRMLHARLTRCVS